MVPTHLPRSARIFHKAFNHKQSLATITRPGLFRSPRRGNQPHGLSAWIGAGNRWRLYIPALLALGALKATSVRGESMRTHEDLVRHLERNAWLTAPHMLEAMRRVDRKNYIDESIPDSLVYMDRPLPNGPSETISAPHMHATALELLSGEVKPGARVLDVGSGSGYLTACFGYAVAPDGHVVGLEKFSDLAAKSLVNIGREDGQLLQSGIIQIRSGNALADFEDHLGTFNAIHVGAAAAEMPLNLRELLAPGGKMLVPIGSTSGSQVLTLVERAPDPQAEPQFSTFKLMNVQYVPLTPPES